MDRVIRAAAVQSSSVFMDRDATTDKAVSAILEAGKNGAEVIVLPETFIPCYPMWVWTADSVVLGPALYSQLYEQSVERDDETIAKLQGAAREASAIVACGINERDGGSLYNTQVLIDSEGSIMGYRRKLMPTGAERTVWGRGDSRDLRVWNTHIGKVGALICYEHMMTPARAALAGLGEEIHLAMWPAQPDQDDLLSIGTIEIMMQSYAIETQGFVIYSSSWQDEAFFQANRAAQGGDTAPSLIDAMAPMMSANTGIIGPNGRYLAGSLRKGEGIVYADLDPAQRLRAKFIVDGAGHYTRPDALGVVIHDSPPGLVTRISSQPG